MKIVVCLGCVVVVVVAVVAAIIDVVVFVASWLCNVRSSIITEGLVNF